MAEAHRALVELHAAGAVTPLISHYVKFDGPVPEALARLTGGATTGKTVVV